MWGDNMTWFLKLCKRCLGFQKRSVYVDNYFFKANMVAGIYLSILTIILELWMIIRTTHKIIVEDLYSEISYYLRNYYLYYFILLIAGISMFTFSILYVRGKTKNKFIGNAIKWIFSFVSLYFGIMVSLNDYAKGEQILTFLTMELFIICLLVWRPWKGFLILTISYGIYIFGIGNIVHGINDYVPVNIAYKALTEGTSADIGITTATKINLFTMWMSTFVFCISNYNKTLVQAENDENLEKMNQHLSQVSIRDDLTGIHNMLYFRQESDSFLRHSGSNKKNVIFLFFDIENFKSYNETYGFHKGNELLVKTANMIVEAFQGSLVSRYSDDHFVVLTNMTDTEKIAGSLSAEIRKMEGEVKLDIKCGAYKPDDGEYDPSLACDRARFACNSIKKHFDCCYRLYDHALEDKFTLKQYILNSIDDAIRNENIKVYYQPVVSTENGFIVGLEALARWHDPNYGLMPPGQFIETLEEYRQIHKLDKCIIRQVCRDYRYAADNHLPFVPVSLNFSRLDFELCDIVRYLEEMVTEFDVPKNFLDIEITESALVDKQDILTQAIIKLRSTGYKVWLDDFGSGYSSLNVLKDYQFDVLKIDMKFLTGFKDNLKTRPILKNIVGLTKQLDMVSLSEGVETKEQFEFLRSIGCNRVQGYLFSRPVPIEDLRNRIADGELEMDKNYMIA